MEISPLQEIFILLEDEKEVPLYRLNRWGKQARGVLAKLKNLSWAEKTTIDNEPGYQITQKGEKEIDKILKPLKETGKWDGKWRLVIFDVPETKRDDRDRLRRSLTKLGLGKLQASVWISPNDIKNEITEIEKRLQLSSAIKFFEVTRNSNLDKTIIEKSWNLPELEDDYRQFNLKTSRTLIVIKSNPKPSYTAKKLIFEYALILQKDPILPWEFRNQDNLRKIAHEYYLKLRVYID